MVKRIIVYVFCIACSMLTSFGFPTYYELNVGETLELPDGKQLVICQKNVIGYDSSYQRVLAASVKLEINGNPYTIKVGYESNDLVAEGYRIGIDLIKDYCKSVPNQRIDVHKDVRLRISEANEPLMLPGKHVYPLFSPWNSGFRNQGWLSLCYNIKHLEGKKPASPGRYHDGYDFGLWEGQLIRSVSSGIIIEQAEIPGIVKKFSLYDKNHGEIGGNPLLIKDASLPVIYYYTHLSGLTRNYHPGDTVKKGEIIGYGSARGGSGGWYHLHLGMIHTENEVFINPYPYIKQWYNESMAYYADFISCFDVYTPNNRKISEYEIESKVLQGIVSPTSRFCNTIPGVIHMREAISEYPFTGVNHVLFDQMAVMKSMVNFTENIEGELWFGHSGISRVYLNGKLIYSGENKHPYHAGNKPFQWDRHKIQCKYQKGDNEIVVFIKQTNPYWSFSLRVRDKNGNPVN